MNDLVSCRVSLRQDTRGAVRYDALAWHLWLCFMYFCDFSVRQHRPICFASSHYMLSSIHLFLCR